MSNNEPQDILGRYARRTTTYHPWDPWVMATRQEFERATAGLLLGAGVLPPGGRTVLDMGCGSGTNLHFMLRLGFRPDRLVGVDLIDSRIARARETLPIGVTLVAAEGSQISLGEEQFDVVLQSLVFSSILDDGLQQSVAESMWRHVRPGGGVLWYDFTWDNPANRDVRGVSKRRVHELFPSAIARYSRITLAPPIARRVCAVDPGLYSVMNLLSPLRTHLLAWLMKPKVDGDPLLSGAGM